MSAPPATRSATTPTIGNHNFEIIGVLAGTGVNGVDADPAQVINDFLTNAQYGAGFDPASIDATTLFGAGGDACLQTYCRAMGIAFSPALTRPGAGLEHPGALAADLAIARRSGAAASSSSFPTAMQAIAAGDATTTVQFAIPTPVHDELRSDAAADHRGLRGQPIRLRRRRDLCVHRRRR